MSQPDKDSASTSKEEPENGSSGIPGAFRPLVKELVKAGLVAYDTVSEKTSGLAKQFNELLEEARAEAVKPPSTPNTQEEKEKKGSRGSKTGKAKDAHEKG